jgi:hypothetical protein
VTERVSIPRVRSVRLKSGGATLRLIRPAEEHDCAEPMLRLAQKIRAGAKRDGKAIAGYAIVAWQADGRAWSAFRNGRLSPISGPMVPDIVRAVLVNTVAHNDARDLINEANGFGPPDEGA